MKYDLSIPDRVLDQLADIAAWYERKSGSTEIAIDWYNGFLKELERLKENPESFPLVHEADPEFEDVRNLLYGSGKRKTHRALFRIAGESVEVMSIRHLSQQDMTPDDYS